MKIDFTEFYKPLILSALYAAPTAFCETATQPLITSKDMQYLGAFRMPAGQTEGDRLEYGGRGVAYNPNTNSLILGGNLNDDTICEVSIPNPAVNDNYNSLPMAAKLQACGDIFDGNMGGIGPSSIYNPEIGGNLVYKGKIITTAFGNYDGNGEQTKSHSSSNGLSLSSTGNFLGWSKIDGAAHPRAMAGYMALIPPSWQEKLGGPAITGHAGGNIVKYYSAGPGASVFDPSDVGNASLIPGETLLNYDDPEGPISKQYFYWKNIATVDGAAFPEGSRSVIFFGSTGQNGCYGRGTHDPSLHGKESPWAGKPYCYDTCKFEGSDGTHANSFTLNAWAYDAQDLEDVKKGLKKYNELVPYATWPLAELNTNACVGMSGAGFDPATNRVFIAPKYGANPIIHVYKINLGTGDGTIISPPSAPKNLGIEATAG